MKLTWKTCIRVGLIAFLVFLCIYYWEKVSAFFTTLSGALTPIVLGLAIAYVVNIVMSRYEQWYFPKSTKAFWVKTRRPVCLVAAMITIAAIIAAVIWLVVPELISCVTFLVAEIPPVIVRLLQSPWVVRIVPENWLAALNAVDWMDSISKVLHVAGSGLGDAVTTVFTAVAQVVSLVVTIFLGFVFSIYLLFSKERLQHQCLRLGRGFLKEDWLQKVRHCMKTLNQCFHRFIVGQCTEAVILGVLCMVGMWIFRFPYATMISVLVGFTALIPVAGAYIGAGVGAVMILTQSPVKALLFLIFVVVLQQLEGNLIYPKVVGDTIGLPAFFVLAAVTVGGALGGILGMLLGVPLTATVYRLVREHLRQKELAKTIVSKAPILPTE